MLESKNTPLSFKEKREKFKIARPTKFSSRMIFGLVGLLVLIVGGVSASILGKINQDLRQQADTGDYNTSPPAVASDGSYDPETGRFGWNYETGKAATPDDWTNTDIHIAGTYVHCQEGECKRYVVAIDSTQKAFQEYVNENKPTNDNDVCVQKLSGQCVAWKPQPTKTPTKAPEAPPKIVEVDEKIKTETGECSTCSGGKCISWDPTKPYPGNDACEGTTGIVDLITQSDYTKCMATEGNTHSECKGILDNLGKIEPTRIPTKPPIAVKEEVGECSKCSSGKCISWDPTKPYPGNDVCEGTTGIADVITKSDYDKCMTTEGNTHSECKGILDHLGEIEPTRVPTAIPKKVVTPVPEDEVEVDIKNIGDRCNPAAKNQDGCKGDCKFNISGWPAGICASNEELAKTEEKKEEEPAVKKTDGEKCVPILGQCENTCSYNSELIGFYCAKEEETPKPEEKKPEISPPPTKPSPLPTAIPNYNHLPDWNDSCAQTCQPGLKCINNVCLADCPSIPDGNCSNSGVMCENTEFINKGKTYVCKNGTWDQRGELKINFDESCSEEDKNIYRESFSHAPESLLPNETIPVSCGEAPKVTTFIDGEEYEGYACGQYGYRAGVLDLDSLSIFCNDPNCKTAIDSGYDCDYVITHELAHNQANEENFWGSTDIESYNKAIGCHSLGEGKFGFDNEQPVTHYGRSACAEAYAELVTVYSEEPCYIKDNYPIQYEWVTTDKHSPFQGDNSCDGNSKG